MILRELGQLPLICLPRPGHEGHGWDGRHLRVTTALGQPPVSVQRLLT